MLHLFYIIIDSGAILQTIQRIDYLLVYTLRHVTVKFAHMNGHWKAYDIVSNTVYMVFIAKVTIQ